MARSRWESQPVLGLAFFVGHTRPGSGGTTSGCSAQLASSSLNAERPELRYGDRREHGRGGSARVENLGVRKEVC